MSIDTKPTQCPYCNERLDAATGVGSKDNPEPGDITLCLYCCNIMRFDDEMAAVKFTPEEWAELGEGFQQAILATQDELIKAKREIGI